jgi:ribosomal-protein-alanine N-acetyltransferase
MACPFVPDDVPVLDSGAVVLRGITPDDASAWFSCLRHTQVTRLTSWDIRSIKDVHEAISDLAARFVAKEAMRWAVTTRDVTTRSRLHFVGTCGFTRFDGSDGRGEIGYELAPPYWGRGIMSASLDAVLRYGFGSLGLHRVEATVMVGNVRSARLLERHGFTNEGRLRGYRNARGRFADMWIYGLLRQESTSAR